MGKREQMALLKIWTQLQSLTQSLSSFENQTPHIFNVWSEQCYELVTKDAAFHSRLESKANRELGMSMNQTEFKQNDENWLRIREPYFYQQSFFYGQNEYRSLKGEIPVLLLKVPIPSS